MKDFASKNKNLILLVTAGFVSLILIISAILLFNAYEQDLKDQSEIKADLYTTTMMNDLKEVVNEYRGKTELAAEKLVDYVKLDDHENYQNVYDFLQRLRLLDMDERFKEVAIMRYFHDGVEYNNIGNEFSQTNESQSVLQFKDTKEPVCAGVVWDKEMNKACVAFLAPIHDCEYAETLVFMYPTSSVLKFAETVAEDYLKDAETVIFCSREGEILNVLVNEGEAFDTHENVFGKIEEYTNNRSFKNEVQDVISSGKQAVYNMTFGGRKRIVSVASTGAEGASMTMVGIYVPEVLYAEGYSTLNTILGAVMLLVFVFIAVVIFYVISAHQARVHLRRLQEYNEDLGCATQLHFEKDAAEIISRNKATNFAVVLAEIQHFNYLADRAQPSVVNKLLKQFIAIIKDSLKLEETFAFVEDSTFLILFHYRNQDELFNRVALIASLMNKQPLEVPFTFNIRLRGGIYETELDSNLSVRTMIDNAWAAKDATNARDSFPGFRVYDKSQQDSKKIQQYIEINQESALANGDFQVFYQPKMNLKTNRPDSSEALIRWYNHTDDSIMRPGVFMPLFESNGFVMKLDKFVYKSVLKYMSESSKNGDPLYPVSVNVSRLTAAQDDFLDYYIAQKEEYGIADGFITIEFTESFAYENYERMRMLINRLHEHGFKCSIDDFGTGYSSYNLLKELPMDEIKLDQFFIHKGISDDRDIKILTSVINVAKALNLKVVSEGVEIVDHVELLKRLNCDVIQGYYYSKPLSEKDFIEFLRKNTLDSSFVERQNV